MHGLLRDGFTSIGLFLVVKTAQCVLCVLISCGVVSIRIQFYEVCVFGKHYVLTTTMVKVAVVLCLQGYSFTRTNSKL